MIDSYVCGALFIEFNVIKPKWKKREKIMLVWVILRLWFTTSYLHNHHSYSVNVIVCEWLELVWTVGNPFDRKKIHQRRRPALSFASIALSLTRCEGDGSSNQLFWERVNAMCKISCWLFLWSSFFIWLTENHFVKIWTGWLEYRPQSCSHSNVNNKKKTQASGMNSRVNSCFLWPLSFFFFLVF